MAKYKIIFDKEKCIGAMNCVAVNDKFWIHDGESKVNLVNSKLNESSKKFELIIGDKDLELNKQAADECPVDAIEIEKIE
ncbi:ferredoxin [Candidatus Woesearchaeota archaeon]|nr:ferredoxin [Candidatus Woesearchaeota archaeon]